MTQFQDPSVSPPSQASQQSIPPASPDPLPNPRPLLWFVQRYPLIFWSVLFSSLMFLTALATVLLVNQPKFTAEKPQPAVSASPLEPVTPLATRQLPSHWTLGAITLSCATVSFFITMSLGGSTKPPRRLIKQSKTAPHSEPRQQSKSALLNILTTLKPPQQESGTSATANGTAPQPESALPPAKPAPGKPIGNSTPQPTSPPSTSANP
jgi:hypothetical protein